MSRACLLLTMLVLVPSAAYAQTTWYVDVAGVPPGSGTPGAPYVSLQQAIAAPTTAHGDTLLVAPGDYAETIDFLAKSLTVRAMAGPLATRILPGAPADPIVVTIGEPGMAHPMSILEGFTIRRDPPRSGIGVRILDNSAGRLVRCIVTGHGIGIADDYDLFLDESTVTLNSTGIGGGSLGIHRLENTICHGNLVRDFFIGAFGPCLGARWSDMGAPLPFDCSPIVDNFDADPRFWDAAGEDFRLRPDSPCIDRGDPSRTDADGSRLDVGALPYDATHAPGTATTCFGTAALCPCGNAGAPDAGCDLAQSTGGIALSILDFAPDGVGGGTADLVGAGYPPTGSPGVTVIRSPAAEDPPVVFGDGLRCIATAGLLRVSASLARGGASANAISHGAGAGTFHYQLWVRNLPATFCDAAAAFNLSNALAITW